MNKTLCDFNSSKGRITQPTCLDYAKYTLTVIYNEVETDILLVCESCKDYIIKDARSRGYNTKIKKV